MAGKQKFSARKARVEQQVVVFSGLGATSKGPPNFFDPPKLYRSYWSVLRPVTRSWTLSQHNFPLKFSARMATSLFIVTLETIKEYFQAPLRIRVLIISAFVFISFLHHFPFFQVSSMMKSHQG